jgi:DNA-binding YbaB/EbfC family protein
MTDGMNLAGLFDTWQRLRGEVEKARAQLGEKTVTGETGGGMVRAEANGRGEITTIAIDATLVAAGEKKMIEDLLVGAVNLAIERAHKLEQEEITRATAGFPLPTDLFGGM